jgi:hypothetical protein
VYGTSGDRILLWFDLLDGEGERLPMGSEATPSGTPRFEVRAVGALEQLPGCPAHSASALSPERLERLCKGECYNPGERRRRMASIEVVRIRPQVRPDEPIEDLIDDPWRRFDCPPDPAGCRVRFEDDEFPKTGREALYYVRALQEPTLAVNGGQLRCIRDAQGRCVELRPCYASGPDEATDDCLAPIQERAWSSPIYLSPAAAQGR